MLSLLAPPELPMPTPNNTINFGPTPDVHLRAVQIEKVPPQIQRPSPRMRLVFDKNAGRPALAVLQGNERVLTICMANDGYLWEGFVTAWFPGVDGTRQPFDVGIDDFEALRLLHRLLAGLDFAAARKARKAREIAAS
jgi:hypothetical protein